ncbi:MAG: DUF411 domain-containing protein [Hyphomicrobiales bacterium]|nr:DUF411 domain-containing protein [Hyphomicrobiales bacterium]
MQRAGLLAMVITLFVSATLSFAGEPQTMTVWKSPWCGCCGNWVKHMEEAGFTVEVREIEDLDIVKRQAGIPEKLQSCHTATVGGYIVEGHVPASDVKRLLQEQPKVGGLAVPGMPSGSPGMEDGSHDPYEVLTFSRNGDTTVFNRY